MNIKQSILHDVAGILTEEWNSRTRFGKVLYPLWVFDSVMQWLTILFFLGVMMLINAFVKAMSKPDGPTIYKEEQ